MRRWGVLVLVGLTLSGCKYLDRRDRDERPTDKPVSNPKPRFDPDPADKKSGPSWLDGPVSRNGSKDLPPTPAGRTSPGSSLPDFKDANFDLQNEVKGALAGYVEDPDGRKVGNVYIEVQPVNQPRSGAPLGVETNEQGYFLIRGLKSGQTYTLSVKAKRDGRDMAGHVYAKPPSPYVRVPLIEGLVLPGDTGVAPSGGTGTIIPPPALPGPAPLSRDRTGPSGGNFLEPSPVETFTDPPSRSLPPRADLVAPGPSPGIRPPAASIPTTAPSSEDFNRSQSRLVRPKSAFSVVDTLGHPVEFPTGRDGELILVDFMTTACLPCKKAVPKLMELQSNYGSRGLDVIGIVCDESESQQRIAMATKYKNDHKLNYLLYVEPGNRPGQLQKRFGVEVYPTLMLFNAAGDVLWKGDPRKFGELDTVIRSHLRE